MIRPNNNKDNKMPVANNPIDTAEQRAHERYALELYNSPELTATRAQVRDYWLELAQPSDVMRSCFDWAFEEVMFGAVVWAVGVWGAGMWEGL